MAGIVRASPCRSRQTVHLRVVAEALGTMSSSKAAARVAPPAAAPARFDGMADGVKECGDAFIAQALWKCGPRKSCAGRAEALNIVDISNMGPDGDDEAGDSDNDVLDTTPSPAKGWSFPVPLPECIPRRLAHRSWMPESSRRASSSFDSTAS